MHEFVGQNILITCDQFFLAEDGYSYRGIWGTLKAIRKVDELIGFAPNRPNVNWVYEVGNMIINGCQVKWIILCPNKPFTERSFSWTSSAEYGLREYETKTQIYIANK